MPAQSVRACHATQLFPKLDTFWTISNYVFIFTYQWDVQQDLRTFWEFLLRMTQTKSESQELLLLEMV